MSHVSMEFKGATVNHVGIGSQVKTVSMVSKNTSASCVELNQKYNVSTVNDQEHVWHVEDSQLKGVNMASKNMFVKTVDMSEYQRKNVSMVDLKEDAANVDT